MNDFYGYDNLIEKISKKILLEFEQLEAVYNFEIGQELEIAFCEVLRKFLPLKYGVVRGFVVDKEGKTAGDDIIIYDQINFPTLRFLNNNSLIKKQKIPIEAVYAYIEVKNTLDDKTFLKAIQQVKKVKKLCYKRDTVFYSEELRNNKTYFSNKYNNWGAWLPTICNPVYGMIFSRFSVDDRNKKSNDSSRVNEFARSIINKNKKVLINNGFYNPEVIVFGQSNIAISCHKSGIIKNGEEVLELTKFHTGIAPNCGYQINSHDDNSFGLALASLIMGLNTIQLVDMPWEKIFNCAKIPDNDYRRSVEEIVNNYND